MCTTSVLKTLLIKHTGIMYCLAKDRPSPDALRARPNLPTHEIQWLKRHDREKRILIRMPRIVFVKLYNNHGSDLSWTLPGLSELGLYVIVQHHKEWFSDKGRWHFMFNIK